MTSVMRALGTIAGAALLLCCVGCGEEPTSAEDTVAKKPATVPQVAVSAAGLQAWPETVRVQGTLLPFEESVVGTKVAGRIEKVAVDLGSVVRKDDVLVTIDERDYSLRVQQAEAQLAQACAAIGLRPDQSELDLNRENSPPVRVERAALEEAQASYNRGEQLQARKAITEDELKRLEAGLKAANARYASSLNNVGEQIALIGVRRADLELARQELADAQIKAPFDGIVERRHVDPGEHVQVGNAVVTLVRADMLRFSGGVPERQSHLVQKGQTIQIRLESESQPIEAVVTRVSPAVTQSGRSLAIEADVPNADLRWKAGLFAEADIVVDMSSTALAIPESAVMEFAGIEKVWIVRNEEAAELPIRTGRRSNGLVEILEGLAAGDVVITDSKEGQAGKVAVIEAPREPQTANRTPDLVPLSE